MDSLIPNEIEILKVKPKFAILGYSDENNNYPFMEFRRIDNKGKLSSGKPLYSETLAQLLENYSSLETDKWYINGIISKRILSVSLQKKTIVWFYKQPKEYMHFKNNKVKSGLYNLPNLIFKYKKGDLYVFATKRISERASLYHAPLWNTNALGHVCLGNVKFNFLNYNINNIIETIEHSFFGSEFTHSNHGNIISENYKDYMNSIVNTNEKFNNNLLVKSSVKLKNIL